MPLVEVIDLWNMNRFLQNMGVEPYFFLKKTMNYISLRIFFTYYFPKYEKCQLSQYGNRFFCNFVCMRVQLPAKFGPIRRIPTHVLYYQVDHFTENRIFFLILLNTYVYYYVKDIYIMICYNKYITRYLLYKHFLLLEIPRNKCA